MKKWVLLLLLLGGAVRTAAAQEDVSLVINEILADPNGAAEYDTDGNGIAAAADEYVELYNGGSASLDLSGWELWDGGSGRWFVFPPGAGLAPGGFAAVVAGVQAGGALPPVEAGSLIFDAGRGSGVLNNSQDNVVLLDPVGNRFWQVVYSGDSADDPPLTYSGFPATAQRVGGADDFGTAREGVARTRAPDGAAEVVDHDAISAELGSPGRTPAAPSAVALGAIAQRQAPQSSLGRLALLLSLLTWAWYRRRQEMAGVWRR